MRIKTRSFRALNLFTAKIKLKKEAKFNLAIIKNSLSVNEILMDRYLRKNNNISLVGACTKLINNFNVCLDGDESYFIITFNQRDNVLADLITYGNLEIKGIDILRMIFDDIFWKEKL